MSNTYLQILFMSTSYWDIAPVTSQYFFLSTGCCDIAQPICLYCLRGNSLMFYKSVSCCDVKSILFMS